MISKKTKYVVTDLIGNMYVGNCSINGPNVSCDFRKAAIYNSSNKALEVKKDICNLFGIGEEKLKIAKIHINIELFNILLSNDKGKIINLINNENIISNRTSYVIVTSPKSIYTGDCNFNGPNISCNFKEIATYNDYDKAESLRKGLIWRYKLNEKTLQVSKLNIKLESIEDLN